MEYRSGTEIYYRQMMELQDKLRKSEEERLKLEEKFNEIMQQSRDAEYERLRILRHKYHKFLEEDKVRQERNENILQTLDRIDSRAKQLAAKTDRFQAFRKQYFENYLKQIPKQKQQTFDSNLQSTNRPPQSQYHNESVRRKLFANPNESATANENVETKLALLEKYLRDNFDNFPRDFSTSTSNQNGIYDGKQTNVLYDNKNYLDDASDSKESQEVEVDRYSPSKMQMNGHQKTSELLGNRIERELNRLRDKKEKELNNNSLLDVQEINPEQVINDYKKLVSKSEEKFGLRNELQNGMPKKTEVLDSIAQISEVKKSHTGIPYNLDQKEESNLKFDLLEDEENSEDTKPPTDISLNLSSPSQMKEEFKQDQIEILPQISNKEYLDNSSKSEEITSIEKQKVQALDVETKQSDIETKPVVKTPEISYKEEKLEQDVEYNSNLNALNYSEQESNQQYMEEPQLNEFGEAVLNQQHFKEQKQLPETYSEVQQQEYSEEPYDEIQGQYNDQVQPNYQQDYENTALQGDTQEVYDGQQYENQDSQYKNSKQYESPEHQFESPAKQSEQQYVNPEQQYESPEQYTNQEQYVNPEQQEYLPAQQEYPAEQQYLSGQQEYPAEQQYLSEQQEYPAEQQYLSEQEYPTERQEYPAEQQEYPAEQQEYPAEQQYPPEQQEYSPEKQEYPPDQLQYLPEQQEYPPEQQEYPPENYDQQYPQQAYPEGEGEYDPQSYSQQQQPDNYDTQSYPQHQYPEGYDPQQYTEGQQLEYEQQYPQGENYQNQQFVENTGEYDPQGQYPENLYQTGQEYLQGEQNVDLQYETEQQQQEYTDGYIGQGIEQNLVEDGQVNETVTESDEIAVSQQKQFEDNKLPLVQKKLPNLADMLDTDTSESVKPDSKVSDSDFDISNTKT